MDALTLVMSQWWLPLLAAPFIGSFLGVLILRLPAGEALVVSRSRCAWCRHPLGLTDLMPLLSWFALRRRCRYCGSPLGWFYPNIELAALAVAAWAATEVAGWLLWASCGLGWALLTLAVIDSRRMILPDVLTLPLLVAGLAVSTILLRDLPVPQAVGAIAGFAAFCGIGWVYRRLRGRDGLGLGDAKLLAAGGAWVSWYGLPSVVLFSAVAALLAVLGSAMLGGKVEAGRRLPFGPELCLGIWLVWLYGPLAVG